MHYPPLSSLVAEILPFLMARKTLALLVPTSLPASARFKLVADMVRPVSSAVRGEPGAIMIAGWARMQMPVRGSP